MKGSKWPYERERERERERDLARNCYNLHQVKTDIFRSLLLRASCTRDVICLLGLLLSRLTAGVENSPHHIFF